MGEHAHHTYTWPLGTCEHLPSVRAHTWHTCGSWHPSPRFDAVECRPPLPLPWDPPGFTQVWEGESTPLDHRAAPLAPSLQPGPSKELRPSPRTSSRGTWQGSGHVGTQCSSISTAPAPLEPRYHRGQRKSSQCEQGGCCQRHSCDQRDPDRPPRARQQEPATLRSATAQDPAHCHGRAFST